MSELGVCKPETESIIFQKVVGDMGYMQRKQRKELHKLYFLHRVIIDRKSVV